MPDVQATIQLLVDFHLHPDESTVKFAALDPVTRQAFLTECSRSLHGDRLEDFKTLHQSPSFRPLLPTEGGTKHPSLSRINQALVTAIIDYNEQNFGLTFDQTAIDAAHGSSVAVPPYTCIQWIWVGDHWVAKYNYDLVATAGLLPTIATSMGVLSAHYRVALTYP